MKKIPPGIKLHTMLALAGRLEDAVNTKAKHPTRSVTKCFADIVDFVEENELDPDVVQFFTDRLRGTAGTFRNDADFAGKAADSLLGLLATIHQRFVDALSKKGVLEVIGDTYHAKVVDDAPRMEFDHKALVDGNPDLIVENKMRMLDEAKLFEKINKGEPVKGVTLTPVKRVEFEVIKRAP